MRKSLIRGNHQLIREKAVTLGARSSLSATEVLVLLAIRPALPD